MKITILSTIILLVMQAKNHLGYHTNTTTTVNDELVPSGISIPEYLKNSYSVDYSDYGNSLPYKFRTFNITPKHEVFPDNMGVKFTIEDVSPALAADLNIPKISLKKYKKNIASEVNLFYKNLEKQKHSEPEYKRTEEELLRAIEVFSAIPDNLVYTGADAVLASSVIAFSKHLPLTLNPDHIWLLILYAISVHVEQNSEKLRHKFINHKDKKELIIAVNSIIKGETPADLWEKEVFPKFSQAIKNNLASEDIHKIITDRFSSTTSAEQSCKEIMLMGITKKYFKFRFASKCGIPSITLLGSEKDWQSIIERTEALLEYVTPEFKDFWLPKLKPVLEKFLDAYRGNIDYTFWQTMVKLRSTAVGSGAYPFISGWIQILFPYLSNKTINKKMKSWNESFFYGPKVSDFPHIMASVPIKWEYYNSIFNIHYHAGIVGFSQNPKDGSLMPVSGWKISYDDPKKDN